MSTRAFAVKGGKRVELVVRTVRRSIVSPSSALASQVAPAHPSSGADIDVHKVSEHGIEVDPLDEGEENSKEADDSDVFKSAASEGSMLSLCVNSRSHHTAGHQDQELATTECVGDQSIDMSTSAGQTDTSELSHNNCPSASAHEIARLRAISAPAVLAGSSYCKTHCNGDSNDRKEGTTVILEGGDVTPFELINKATHLSEVKLGPGLVNDINVLTALAIKLDLKSISTSKGDVLVSDTIFSLGNSPSLTTTFISLTYLSITTTKKALATLLAMMPTLEIIKITIAEGHEVNDYSLDAALEVVSRLVSLESIVLTLPMGEQITGVELVALGDKLRFLTLRTPDCLEDVK
ncbi:hypothetical protein E4T47_05044 [Aureobasidium subglaciale]|nr:hypothetical protein E4T47_05044 [Aureobasidium subglaciale]